MNKKTIIWGIVTILIIVGGVIIVKKAKKRDESAPIAKTYPIVISTFTPKTGDIELTLPYLALVQNDNDVILSSKIASRINYIKPSGSQVGKGDIIVRLDDTGIKSNLSSVESQLKAVNTSLKNLEATHRRTIELLEVEGASIEQSQMEESKIAEITSKKNSLLQKLNELNNMLTYAIVKSPVNGKISKTMANKGNMAMPGHPIANIRSNNGFYLLIRVAPDLNISGVLFNDKKYDVIPLNSTFNGLAEYKAYVDENKLTTGERIEIKVIVYQGNGLALPFDAILNREGKSYVLLTEGDKAFAKQVDIIQSGEEGVVVSDTDLAGRNIVVAKPDILLKLLAGNSLMIKEG
jgi:multidrug efflux pump subunit AcrA (membrane-fusion protein)